MTLDQPDSAKSHAVPAGVATTRGRSRRWLRRTAMVIAASIRLPPDTGSTPWTSTASATRTGWHRFDLDHQTSQLLEFIMALRLERPVVVGHSSGAAIAAAATLRNPQAVGGLMFLDGDALATGAGSRSPLTHMFIEPYRTTLRLAVRSATLVEAVYRKACGPGCPQLDAAGIDQ